MYPYYGHYYSHEDYVSALFHAQAYDPGFIDERLMGPPGPPQGFPGFPPSFPQQGQGQGQGQSGPPSSPPPSFVPAQTQSQQVGTFAVDPGSIRFCLFRFTYLWLRNRQQFWYYPVFVGRQSISGFRWNGFRWVFFGVSLRQIESFTCV
jgi:hypothetical protein